MATKLEIEQCFDAIRKQLLDEATKNHKTETPEFRLTSMALYILESIVIDIKRIADQADRNTNYLNPGYRQSNVDLDRG